MSSRDRRPTKSRRCRQARQVPLSFPEWGGARVGAGRKRTAERAQVPHRPRAEFASRFPVHVTMHCGAGLESLRRRRSYNVVRDAIVAACDRFRARLVHFAVLSNHVHLICEAESAEALSRAMKGLAVRIAKRLNASWARTGRVFDDRYHVHVLRMPLEVKNALAYVLQNARRHGAPFLGPDPCSSGVWFEGWRKVLWEDPLRTPCPLPRPRTWLLSVGWQRHGWI